MEHKQHIYLLQCLLVCNILFERVPTPPLGWCLCKGKLRKYRIELTWMHLLIIADSKLYRLFCHVSDFISGEIAEQTFAVIILYIAWIRNYKSNKAEKQYNDILIENHHQVVLFIIFILSTIASLYC